MYNSTQAALAFFFLKISAFLFQINMSELFHVCAYNICMREGSPSMCVAVRGQVLGVGSLLPL